MSIRTVAVAYENHAPGKGRKTEFSSVFAKADRRIIYDGESAALRADQVLLDSLVGTAKSESSGDKLKPES